ncbi:MAG: phytanoyl-CoA dioxygenase family protein, partial [Pseudomonadota bacterium]|nr:phytanoyl-CoA dioxygenase family protein [Pseudomonadota bacterium]
MAVKLTQDEIYFYHENGYDVARGVYTGEKLEQLRSETDAIIAKAAGVSEHNEVYDLEDSHSPSNPRVRRLKEPYRHFDYFDQV